MIGFSVLLFFLLVIPANADDSTVSLPPLNPSPMIESAPGGLPQMETGEQLPSFDQPNVNVFKDPQGKYTITFPQGTTQQQSPDNDIVAFSLPNQAKAYIPIATNPEENQEAFLDIEDDSIPKGSIVCDVIPNPPQTQFLKVAQSHGAKTLDGLGMLVYQGAIGFKLWTGKDAPISIMKQALKKEFGVE